MANELKITLIVDDQGSIKISQVSGELKKLAGTAQQTGREVAASGKHSQRASVDYDRLSRGVAMAQAKLIALYGTVQGSMHLFTRAMENVDFYQTAIIRLAASEADLAKSGEDVSKVYERAKKKYAELIDYAAIAASKTAASTKEVMNIMEWAVARGQDVNKSTLDNISLLVAKIKQLVPWIKQEGQVLQELNALWSGHARITDTTARLVIDRLKQMGIITATTVEGMTKQFNEWAEAQKKGGFEKWLEAILKLFPGLKVASKDMEKTFGSLKEILESVELVTIGKGFKPIYDDIIKWGEKLKEYYIEGNQAIQHQKELQEQVAAAWEKTKKIAEDLKPSITAISEILSNMAKGLGELPPEVLEIGIIGYFLVGKKGKAAILLSLSLFERIPKYIESFKAMITGHLGLEDFLFGDLDKLDAGIKRLEKSKKIMEEIIKKTRPERYPTDITPEDPWRMAPHPRMMSGIGEGEGFWGQVQPAVWGETEYVTMTRVQAEALKAYLMEVKADSAEVYQDIQDQRLGLDQQYYDKAIAINQEMAGQTQGLYAGMTQAAANYFAESTNMYSRGMEAFGSFVWGLEDALGGFLDVIIWRTASFADVMENTLKRLANALLESLIIQPVVGLISGGLGSLFGGVGNWIGGGGLTSWIGGLTGLGGGGKSGGQLVPGGYLSSWGKPSSVVNMSGISGLGGSSGMGWAALAGMGGLGLMAAMMSGKESGGYSVDYSGTMQEMTINQAIVENMSVGGLNLEDSQVAGMEISRTDKYELNKLIASITANPVGQFGETAYQAINRGYNSIATLIVNNLLISDEGMRSLKEIFSQAAADWQNAVTDTVAQQQEGGDYLRNSIESATDIFQQTMAESGGDFRESINQAGEYFKEKFETIVFPSQGSWWENISTGGSYFNFLPFFHRGGLIRAHDGYLASDERLVIAQTEEGILPRGSMAKLGRKNFEALRRGEFERVDLHRQDAGAIGRKGGSRGGVTVNVQINALDRAGVEAIDWDQVVRRQIVPALRRVEGRRV